MTFATRTTLILILAAAPLLPAQENKPAPATSTQTQTAQAQSVQEVRREFRSLIGQHPSELAAILALDPGLLANEAFLAGYPDLARFVAQHPEIARSPHVYMADFPVPGRHQESPSQKIAEGFFFVSGFAAFLFAVGWLVRTVIEHRRWNRLSRVQSEVHNKILDRFSTSDELLQYVKSPAGTKFLESAPIPLRAEEPIQNAPMGRVLWSIQFGIVVVVGALGLLFVSNRFDKESAQALFALGVIALSVGAGFIAAAFASLALSRRLGLWQGPAPANPADDTGSMR